MARLRLSIDLSDAVVTELGRWQVYGAGDNLAYRVTDLVTWALSLLSMVRPPNTMLVLWEDGEPLREVNLPLMRRS